MRYKSGDQSCLGVVLRRHGRSRQPVIAWIARGIGDKKKACANRPVGPQPHADAAHDIIQFAARIESLAIRLGVALRQHEIHITFAANQIRLLDKGVEIASGNPCSCLYAILGCALGFQIDRGKVVTVDLRLGTFVDCDGLHAIDRQQIEQWMVPDAHVKWNAVNVSLDFTAGPTDAHSAYKDRTALIATKSTHRVVA